MADSAERGLLSTPEEPQEVMEKLMRQVGHIQRQIAEIQEKRTVSNLPPYTLDGLVHTMTELQKELEGILKQLLEFAGLGSVNVLSADIVRHATFEEAAAFLGKRESREIRRNALSRDAFTKAKIVETTLRTAH